MADDAMSKGMQQNRGLAAGPVAILWDIENCPVPSDVNAEDVSGNIRMAIKVHPVITGAVTLFSAYGDFNHIPRRLREGFQQTGVNLIDVPNGKKDASDKAILVDMFLFALDHMPPCTILLISGDVDFSPALHKLGQRGYMIALAIPAGVGVSSALYNAGRFVWDWPSLARGEGLVSAKSFLREDGGFSNHLRRDCVAWSSCNMGFASHSSSSDDNFTEDELCIYQNGTKCPGSEADELWMYHNRTKFSGNETKQGVVQQSLAWSSQNMSDAGFFRSNQPCLYNHVSGTYDKVLLNPHRKDQRMAASPELQDSDYSWVQPGNLEGLKTQLIALVESNGGHLPLHRLPAYYCKAYGRPLYLSEYGFSKLAHLINRMSDAFTINGRGNKRALYLKQSFQAQSRLSRDNIYDHSEESSGTNNVEQVDDDDAVNKDENDAINEIPVMLSDEQKEMSAVRLEVCRLEIQELLVSHACKVPLPYLEILYKQRYGRDLDPVSFGFSEIESLLDQMHDLLSVWVDEKSQQKFLVPKGC